MASAVAGWGAGRVVRRPGWARCLPGLARILVMIGPADARDRTKLAARPNLGVTVEEACFRDNHNCRLTHYRGKKEAWKSYSPSY